MPSCLLEPLVVENATRRQLLGVIGAAGLLGACGREPAAPTSTGGSRSVVTPLGGYDIPTTPRSVLAVDSRVDLETAVALGLPVSATTLRAPAPWVPAPADLPVLSGPVDDEQVYALRPDLIVCSGEDDGEYWPTARLQRIAPVLPTSFESPWRTDLQRVAAWLDAGPRADAAIAEFDRVAAEVRARHAAALAARRVLVVQWVPSKGTFVVNTRGRMQQQVLTDLGGVLFGSERDYAAHEEVPLELVGQFADADGIYLQNLSSEPTLASMVELPVWRDLPAVRAGRVVESPGNVNYGSVYSAIRIARDWDALYRLLA